MRARLFFIIAGCLLCLTGIIYAATPHRSLQIKVGGIDNAVEKNVTLTLKNYKSKLEYPLSRLQVYHFYNKAPKLIKGAIAPYGYFKPHIQRKLTKTRTGWLASFFITPGKATTVTHISVHVSGPGKQLPPFQKYLSHLPIKVGDILKTQHYNDIKSKLFSLANRYGFFKAKMIRNKIHINLYRHTATINIQFQTGPRYRFGKITFTKTVFHENFLQAFLSFHPGDPYDAKKVEKSQQALVTSNYFSQIIIKPNPKKSVHRAVPVFIKVIPRKRKQYTLGLGYGTDTGFRGTAGVTIRHIGNWGQRFKAFARASQENSAITAKYLIPGSNPAKDLFHIETGASFIDQASGTARNEQFGFGYTRKSGNWHNSISLNYLRERYSINDLPRTQTELIYPKFSTAYYNADEPLNPKKGVSFYIQLTGTKKALVSRTDFLQVAMRLNTLWTLEATHTRFLARTSAGFTSIKNLNHLPLSLQLLAGGARSVRGYAYNSLGPGRNLLTLSGEIQQRVYKQFYLTGFVDSGAVGDQDFLSDINVGVGPGVAWISPIGVLEVTIANAITTPKKYWMIQFTMGAAL